MQAVKEAGREMTGLNAPFTDLIEWCGHNYYLLSACELGIGFLPAFAFGYLVFRVSKRLFFLGVSPLTSGRFALLFASAAWGLFLALLSGKLQTLSMGLPAVQVDLLITVVLAPISVFVGIPSFLFYVFKRPVLLPRVIYMLATSVITLSYLYLVFTNKAFDNGS
jgi:hypothetical protein